MSRNILKAVAAWKTGFTEQAEWAGLSRKETATLQKSGSGDRHFHRVHVSLWRGSTRKPTGLNLGGLRLPRRRSPVPTPVFLSKSRQGQPIGGPLQATRREGEE